MKKFKFLGIAVLSLFVLAACGGSDDGNGTTVCTMDDATFRVHAEDGEVTSVVIETAEDVSDLSDAERELAVEFAEALDGFDARVEGDELIVSMTIEGSELAMFGADLAYDAIIADIEGDGGSCN